MKIISITPVEFFYLDEIADLIAYARNPQVDNDPDYLPYQLSLVTATEEVNKAAIGGALNVSHPQTHGPFPMELGIKYAVALPHDVTVFLAGYGISLVIEAPEQSPATPAPVVAALVEPNKSGPVANWKMQIQAEATALCLRLRKSGANPTRHSIIDPMARWCRENGVKTDGGIYPKEGYLRTHVLGGKHWDVPN